MPGRVGGWEEEEVDEDDDVGGQVSGWFFETATATCSSICYVLDLWVGSWVGGCSGLEKRIRIQLLHVPRLLFSPSFALSAFVPLEF